VYHVQTEDKGLSVRLIISLVYDRGTILASKRASYEDLAHDNFDEKVLAERVGRQHKLICAAVKAGRIEELKGMSGKPAAAVKTIGKSVVTLEPVGSVMAPTAVADIPVVDDPIAAPVDLPLSPISEPAGPIDVPPERTIQLNYSDDELIIDADIIDEVFLPDEAVAIVTELSGMERTANTKLSLELLGDTKFKGGDRRTVSVMICRGTERKVVSGAQIMVKVLGSAFRPVIFHARSDANGLAKIHLQMPHFHAGRAAILIRALSGGEEVELRRIVTPG
jgi:hypothetical protein